MKKIIPFLLVLVFAFPVFASAETVNAGYFGTTTESPVNYVNMVDGQVYHYYWTSLTVNGSGSIEWWGAVGEGTGEIGSTVTPVQNATPPSGALGFRLVSNGGEVYAVTGTNTYNGGQTVIWTMEDGSPANYNDGSSSGGGSSGSAFDDTDLLNALGEVKSAVQSNGNTLGEIKDSLGGVNDKLSGISGQLSGLQSSFDDLNSQLTTDDTVTKPSVPDAVNTTVPKATNPTDGIPLFEDDSTYFKDVGDAPEVAGALPAVPDVPKCWVNVGNVCAEAQLEPETELEASLPLTADGALTQDGELNSDDELDKDSELVKDDFQQDGELTKDDFQQDGELSKDGQLTQDGNLTADGELQPDMEMQPDGEMPVLTYEKDSELVQDQYTQDGVMVQDSFTQSPEMTKDQFTQDNFSQTEQYNSSNSYTRNHFYSVTDN